MTATKRMVMGLVLLLVFTGTAMAAPKAKAPSTGHQLRHARLQLQKLYLQQHKRQRALHLLQARVMRLQLQYQQALQQHHQFMMTIRKAQIRLMTLQIKHLDKRKAKPAKRAPVARKKPALVTWRGYIASRLSPVGPRFPMQHPMMGRGQKYLNRVNAKGKYIAQSVVLFGLHAPKASGKLLELQGRVTHIRARKGRRGGYAGSFMRVVLWRVVK